MSKRHDTIISSKVKMSSYVMPAVRGRDGRNVTLDLGARWR
jgi:hypothetical protein